MKRILEYMSLTTTDLEDIRNIIESALAKQNTEIIKPLQGELEAIRNDIKDIYFMISDLQHNTITDKEFKKLSLEKKLLALNAELISAAKQAGITLPRP